MLVSAICQWLTASLFYNAVIIKIYARRTAILGAFAKLRKVTISFVIFVRLSFRMEQPGYRWTDFHEI